MVHGLSYETATTKTVAAFDEPDLLSNARVRHSFMATPASLQVAPGAALWLSPGVEPDEEELGTLVAASAHI